MATTVELKKTRGAKRGCITRIKNSIKTNGSSISLSELECRLSLLEGYFKQYLDVQDSINGEIPEDPDENKYRIDVEELYCLVKSQILESILDKKKVSESNVNGEGVQLPNASNDKSIVNQSAKGNDLPQIKLPTFSGNYIDYPNFIQQFKSAVENDEVPTIRRFQLLVDECLKGDARQAIKSIDITAENYGKALSMLQDRYDNKCIVFQTHIRELFNLPPVPKNSASQLRKLVNGIDGNIRALRSLGKEEDIVNAVLLQLISMKLDTDSYTKWEDSLELTELPTWEDCSKFLNKRCQHLENREIHHPSKPITNVASNFNKKPYKSPTSLSVAEVTCVYCRQCGHHISQCQKFLKLTVYNRYRDVKRLQLCINCLDKGHITRVCSAQRCQECRDPHHSILHRFVTSSQNTVSNSSIVSKYTAATESSSPTTSNVTQPTSLQLSKIDNHATKKKHIFLSTAIVFVKNHVGDYIPARAVLDNGSQLNLITENLVQLLNLKKFKMNSKIVGVGVNQSKVRFATITKIKSRFSNFQDTLEFSILPHITSDQPQMHIDISTWRIPSSVTLADPTFNQPQRIDLLIGADIFFDLLMEGSLKLGPDMPKLQNTHLDWIVAGKCNLETTQNGVCNVITNDDEYNESNKMLNETLSRFWSIEEFNDERECLSDEQKECERIFEETTQQLADGRIVVKLPFKDSPENVLGDSYRIAERRFYNLEKRLESQPGIKHQYSEFMQDYKDLNHMEEVPQNKISLVRYFVPHQCVLRPESTSTKLRVVFDASVRTSSNKSLNDLLMIEPTVQDNLFSIIIRFRSYRFALTADISKMYRQFLVQTDDSYSQCILWRKCSTDELKVYRLKTVTYGTSSAPFLATRSLNFLADIHAEKYPTGSQIIKRDFYVDDLITGANTLEEIAQIRQEVTSILSSGKLELRKWFSNNDGINESIPSIEREKPIRINDSDVIKTLGIIWEPSTDQFHFVNTLEVNNSKRITKRVILAEVSRLFDPLGLICPVIILGKIIMQRLWILKLDWDDNIPEDIEEEWIKFRSQLPDVNKVYVPRCAFPQSEVVCTEVHGFSDASLRGYGGCIYIRCIDSIGNVTVPLISAKAKVAPTATQSLPKLELCAAHLLSKLLDRISKSLNKEFDDIILWTDSEIVLDWLGEHGSTWNVFVANRVSAIHVLTKHAKWQHVPSKANPADIASRGSSVENLLQSSWFSGPEFLYMSSDQWPANKKHGSKRENIPERRPFKTVLVNTAGIAEDMIASHKYINSFSQLRRVFAYCIRFIRNLQLKKMKEDIHVGPLTASELDNALIRMIYYIQQTSFKEDLKFLYKRHIEKCHDLVMMTPKSGIQKLNPFLECHDDMHILRVGGRLQNADIPYHTKFPILLPANHPFVKSYIAYLHSKYMHAGVQALVSISRQRFWIINIKNIARKVVHSCVICFRMRPIMSQQIMGDLPSTRVTISKAFLNTGVDFCGPFATTQGIRGRAAVKSYIAVFVCFVTKAVHLEVVSDLSAKTFLAALQRFIARKGFCQNLFCDNATNFVGARNELAGLRKRFYSSDVQQEILRMCAEDNITFHHIPPRSPHFGGLWEAAVKSAKSLLYRTVADFEKNPVTYEELQTLAARIEAILNSRPMTPHSSDPSDELPITPGHFTTGGPLIGLPEPDLTNSKLSNLDRSQRILVMQQHFWKRWVREYITHLQQRYKWNKESPDVKTDVVVIVHEDNLPPRKWLLGRIVDVTRGKDGHVRVVSIKTKNGIISRAIHKTAPLPFNKE